MKFDLSFRQTRAEQIVRFAATLIFEGLRTNGCELVSLSSLTEDAQYGFTASAEAEPVGPKLVRITDLQDGQIRWETTPYCECPEPAKYLLKAGDILFARTGATTGKTHLVDSDANAVFASYLIRVRPRSGVWANYLYSFFQSDFYWSQIIDEKEGSAQPNVNGRKLMTILVPPADAGLQRRIVEFLRAVRQREDGVESELPPLPPPFERYRRIVEQVSSTAAQHSAILLLRQESEAQLQALCRSILFSETQNQSTRMSDIVSLRQPDTKVERHNSYSFAGVYCFGKGVFKGQTKSGTEFAYDRLTQVRAGEFTYPKLMAWEGALGVVPEECDSLFVSPEYPVFKIDTERVLPEVLDVYYRSPSIWPIIGGASTGTNVRRRRLHPSAFLNLRMPVPPMAIQLRIRQVRRAVEAISAIRHKTEVEVKSLLSAVINRAFGASASIE